MISFESITQRLKNAFGLANDKQLAAALGLNSNAFYNRKRAGSLPYGEIVAFAERHKLSLDWAFFGTGHPFGDSRDADVQPVAELDVRIFQEICSELEVALHPLTGRTDSTMAPQRAALVGGLAAFIYRKVAFTDNEAKRRDMIRRQAEGFAQAIRISQDSAEVLRGSRAAAPRSASNRVIKAKRKSK